MESLKELYRIGPGPSSSHTLAVKRACRYYLDRNPGYPMYLVELYGSLALTGKGHMSDRIIEETFGKEKVIIRMVNDMYKQQPNTMIFHTLLNNVPQHQMIIYSTGGGAIAVEGMPSIVNPNVYPHNSFEQIRQFCIANKMNLAQYVFHFEPDIRPYLLQAVMQMIAVVRSGLKREGVLPGMLKIQKIAKKVYRKAVDCEDSAEKERLMLSAYAYAAMEENACGGTVVTAPTLGSCGIMSALVNYYYEKGIAKETLINALAVAGLFGNLIKTNASISGAKGGCQAEVGTACSMGAAFICYIEQLNIHQTEMAAEIAMEHHLGLTCDPVGGYVQVPCIERNGVGVLRSMDAMLYAKYMGEFKENKVSFDKIVEAMNLTGNKIAMELKETSLGGLAEVLPLAKDVADGCY